MKTFVVTAKIEVPHLREDRVRWYETVVLAKDSEAAKTLVEAHYARVGYIVHKIGVDSPKGQFVSHNRQY